MNDKPMDSWRARATVSEALDVFNSPYMQEVWSKALARRQNDPEGAVTSARTLLEAVCKHIIEESGRPCPDGAPLPALYKQAATALEIAPTENVAPIFAKLFTSCAEVIASLGSLRNHLSDSHGRGPFGTMPDWRHAELAVNLSGAMATYLSAVWKGRQPTVADVIANYIAVTEARKPFGRSQRYSLETLMRSPALKDLIATKLQVSDLVAHCEYRQSQGILAQTVNQDIVYLRGALGEMSADVMDDAIPILRQRKLTATSTERARRLHRTEFDALIHHYREQDKHPTTEIRMAELTEFAVWSGLKISDICELRWAALNREKRTCGLPNGKEILLLDKAWDIVSSRKRANRNDPDEKIFPYNPKSAGARATAAKKALRQQYPEIMSLRFNDLRYEAVNRLLEAGHPIHDVSRATLMDIKRVERISKSMLPGA